MKIYWTLKSVPELAELPAADRREIWQHCYWGNFKDYRQWLALATLGLFVYFGSDLGRQLGWKFADGVIGAAIGGLVFGQVSILLALPNIRAELTRRKQSSPNQSSPPTPPTGG